MAQIKIYGLRTTIEQHRTRLSEALHNAVVAALNLPPDKKFQRFIQLEPEDFMFPADRSNNYIIIEISLFAGRSSEVKKALIRMIFKNIEQTCGIVAQDIEITIVETPKENWGIRGMCGDELTLTYKVEL